MADIGARVNEAMRDIEEHNPQLPSVLPKPYNIFTNPLLKALFERTSETPATLDYDALGRIYEHFLAELARTEGRIGGKFHTSSCIVRIFNEITAHYHGSIVEILPLADRRRAKSRMNRAKSLCARGRRRLCIRSSSGRLSLAPESLHSGKPSSLQS